ncbi:MAG TPA: DMT family transporter [Ignavibacteria bacterium]|nr:DMT family transporter [Ignavibacteria bacterium]
METQNPGKNLNLKSVAAAISGFFFLALVAVLIKLEENGSASLPWIIFIQFFTCLIIMTAIASKNKFRDLKTDNIRYHIIRAVTGLGAFTCLVFAISKIPLVNASLLNNSTPVFIPLISLMWLKTKIDKKIWWGITTGFIGIILILKPRTGSLLQTGDLFGLISGIILAISYVSLKILTRTESFFTILFYYSFIAALLSFPFALANWSDPPLIIWIYGILSGVCFLLYLYLLQYAYRFAEAAKLAPFNYSVVVFTGIFDWVLFEHVPGLLSVAGIILVTLGGILAITLHEKDNKHLKHNWH